MLIDNLEEPTSKQTETLLNAISNRLSGRDDCRKMVYQVIIDHTGVRMNPLVYVFPNRYKRKETDQIDIISFIHQYKMKDALLSGFVFGIYEYQLTEDKKRRRWIKL